MSALKLVLPLSLLVWACAACAVPVNSGRADLVANPGRHALPGGAPGVETGILLDVRLDRQVSFSACGAHVAASLSEYWGRTVPSGARVEPMSGGALFRSQPPESSGGYSVRELADLLVEQGLVAAAVTARRAGVVREVSDGRPVIVRVTLAPEQIRTRTLFPFEMSFLDEVERLSSRATLAMVSGGQSAGINHYWLVAGFTETHLLVMDPAMGLRQVRFDVFDQVADAGGNLAVVVGGWSA